MKIRFAKVRDERAPFQPAKTLELCVCVRSRRLLGRQAAIKPQAEAPHSAPVAPRGARRRRLRRHTCTARACTQCHRSVAARARRLAPGGPTWESERSSSVARARQGARRKGRAQVDGKWRDGWDQLRPPTRLEPAAAGRRRRGTEAKKVGRTHGRIKRGPSQYPEEAAALAFFRVPRFFKGVCRWRPL